MISPWVRDLIGRFPLGFVATVTPDGRPAVSPKGTFLVIDDTRIGFGNIRSPGTLRNLAANPACEVNFIDVFVRKGARIAGRAEVIPAGTEPFSDLHPRWAAAWGELAARITDLVAIRVERVYPLTTPPYDDGATEAAMIAAYKKKFSEIYP